MPVVIKLQERITRVTSVDIEEIKFTC